MVAVFETKTYVSMLTEILAGGLAGPTWPDCRDRTGLVSLERSGRREGRDLTW